jgi:alcohol dehydrogenase class IV
MLNIETFFNTQNIKRFYFPGKVFWGKDCRFQLLELIGPGKTIALFVDVYFAQNEFIKDFQQRYNSQIVLVETIESMPKTGQVDRILAGISAAPDVVVSVGGGSTIDTAKAVIAGFIYGTYDGVGMGARRGMQTLPGVAKPVFISLPTTAGTGADASRYYVVYDSRTQTKVHGKSWELIADWLLLDAAFINKAPERLLINSAFDAFIHYFESYLCKYERSWSGEMLSLDGMARVVSALDRIVHGKDRAEENYLQLLYASTMAGIAISNVRTGIIHEAAGALLEHTRLTHPETLFVFLRETYEHYRGHMVEREEAFIRRLKAEHPKSGFASFENVIEWWGKLFELAGIREDITREISKAGIPATELKKSIFDRIFSDKVWIEKEGPVPMDEKAIRALVDGSLRRFGM